MSDKRERHCGNAILAVDTQLTDREFFDAHPNQDIRRRALFPGELPRSLAGRNIREVEVRNVSPHIFLLRFIDTDGGMPAVLPIFDNDLFLTAEGRQQIVSCLRMMDCIFSFLASTARYEPEAE
jgi:hypothetical protein